MYNSDQLQQEEFFLNILFNVCSFELLFLLIAYPFVYNYKYTNAFQLC